MLTNLGLIVTLKTVKRIPKNNDVHKIQNPHQISEPLLTAANILQNHHKNTIFPNYKPKEKGIYNLAKPLPAPIIQHAVTPPTRPIPNSFDRISFYSPHNKNNPAIYKDEEINFSLPLPENIMPAQKFAALISLQSIEILNGHRPARHLQGWVEPELYQAIVRRTGLGIRISGKASKRLPPTLRRVRVFYPLPRIAECCVIIRDEGRTRAVAVRLEVRHQKWHVTALEII